MDELKRWLEDEGWEITEERPLQASRQRGEKVEMLVVTPYRLRYTLTQPAGPEESRRVEPEGLRGTLVRRGYRESTLTAEITGTDPARSVRTALAEASGPG